jgi:hypothetical protein
MEGVMTEYCVFNGERYYLNRRYFRRCTLKPGSQALLHRAVWEHHKGPIPPAWHVHHRDRDRRNNAIENLELVPAPDHQRRHMLDRSASGQKWAPDLSPASLAKQVEWRRSDAGQEHYRKLGEKNRQAILQLPLHDMVCESCGSSYQAKYPERSKYCHSRCQVRAYRQNRRKVLKHGEEKARHDG